MSAYITLHKLQVQNANCIAGLTYGFPAITHFLGFIHALSRELQASHHIKLDGCAVICHQHQLHTHQPSGVGEFIFTQTRNPLTRLGKVAPIMEEGKMHLVVSLVTRSEGFIGGEESLQAIQSHLETLCYTHKLAGGVINNMQSIFVDNVNSDEERGGFNRRMRQRLLPGFVLLNRSNYLEKHFRLRQQTESEVSLFDAWTDFFTLKYQAIPRLASHEVLTVNSEAQWNYIPKPERGYLVPLLVGYKAISDVHEPGTLKNTRDPNVPFCFVEAAYGVGEWKSPHRLTSIEEVLWFYHLKPGWYLCEHSVQPETIDSDDDDFEFLDYL